jgi:cyclopropane fatty-acyl-phospholipid synthase-like methyltransferase
MTPAYQDFAFPLNVYACVLELEEGQTDYLHYGLFDAPDESAAVAQERSTALLWENLPPPCRLLEVGVGLGTTLARLTSAGYQATGITPDAAQIAHLGLRHAIPLDTRCCRLEDFREGAGTWQALLFQESGQYIDAINLFEKADELLDEEGEILILDEFALRRTTPGVDSLHLLEYFLRLAARFGFVVTAQRDLSARAAPTLDWLLRAVEKHAQTLKARLGVSEEQLAALNQSNRRYQANYSSGIYGYFLLRLRRSTRPRWRVGRVTGQRAPQMRALFSHVFGHPMSEPHWHWKYGEGRGCGIGVWANGNGEMVAHYGGTSRDALLFGKPVRVFQACDLMVSAAERGSLTRKGPAFLAAATFLEQELGYGAPYLLGIGFPNETAYRLPERLGLYQGCIGRIQGVAWPTRRARPSLRYRMRALDPHAPESHIVMERCWRAMAKSLSNHVIGVRDAAYLRHRYASHPERNYLFFFVHQRLTRQPLGLIILRRDNEDDCELLDAVGALANIPHLVHQARRMAALMGCRTLRAWLVDNILPAFRLPPEAVVEDLNVLVPGNGWTAAPDNALVAGKWWLTGGDTDFH